MSNFWDMVLLMISTFFFVAYLIIMFQIVIDLFRDHELGGGSKVLWVIGLIFIPVLTAIIYIIARGKGMAARQQASVQKAKSETESYIKTVAGKSPAADIAEAKALLDAGTISARSSPSSRPRPWPEFERRLRCSSHTLAEGRTQGSMNHCDGLSFAKAQPCAIDATRVSQPATVAPTSTVIAR